MKNCLVLLAITVKWALFTQHPVHLVLTQMALNYERLKIVQIADQATTVMTGGWFLLRASVIMVSSAPRVKM